MSLNNWSIHNNIVKWCFVHAELEETGDSDEDWEEESEPEIPPEFLISSKQIKSVSYM